MMFSCARLRTNKEHIIAYYDQKYIRKAPNTLEHGK